MGCKNKRHRARLYDLRTNTINARYRAHLDDDFSRLATHKAIARLQLRKEVGIDKTAAGTWKQNIDWPAALIADISKH